MKKLFAYGTLLNERVQTEVIGRVLGGSPAQVDGYRILPNYVVNGVEYPIAVRDKAGTITGKWFDVTDTELELLDRYETNDYIRAVLKTIDGTEVHMYVKPQLYEQVYFEEEPSDIR